MTLLKNRLIRSILLISLLALLGAGGYLGSFLFSATTPEQPVALQVKQGMSFHAVARQLHERGVVSNPTLFRLLGRLRNAAASIKAGEYDFSEAATPGAILDRLIVGDVRRYKLTIPEGFNIREIADRIEAAGIAPAEDVRTLADDPAFISRLGIEATSLEGYLFPETYTYISGTPIEQLFTSMVGQFNKRLEKEVLQKAADTYDLDRHQLVTLASIVQKEAGNNDEMPLIAAVFLNRLKKRIPLQADPTVIYGLGDDFDGNITRAHLRMPTPYNTYTMFGLPPGPIASPGVTALRAVAYPADVKYLYFVAKGDGTHTFSHTLKEHNRAVRKYQLKQ